MEAAPRLPMVNFELRISTEPVAFGPPLKQYITSYYGEDGNSYTTEIGNLEALRAAVVRPNIDVAGCQLLKKYYCQLAFVRSRFPMGEEQTAAVNFSWKDPYSSIVGTVPDIHFEMSCIMYNIGALHSQLGAMDARTTPDGMKMACTHFQCAAWSLQTVLDTYSAQQVYLSSVDVVHFMLNVCLAQAQECILEKSMLDNRKPTIIAKVAVQVVNYYTKALNTLRMADETAANELIGSKTQSEWTKYVSFKIAYHRCVTYLFQGQQAEEQQKMGERVAYCQAASEHLDEARKIAIKLKSATLKEGIVEALTFTTDVVEGKKKAAINENEFIYHEEVPDKHRLQHLDGAVLVKGTPFSVNDAEVSGADIFARLVPMEAHEASSLYSERKALLLRQIGDEIEVKNHSLVEFLSSLDLDVVTQMHQATGLSQDIIDRWTVLSQKPTICQDFVDVMSKVSSGCDDVAGMLAEIDQLLRNEDTTEQQYQEIVGKRPPSMIATDLQREAVKYREAHTKADESNSNLRRAIYTHITNLKVLSQPLAELKQKIPEVCLPNENVDEEAIKNLDTIISKVEEMRTQRAMLWTQLREAVHADDITNVIVTNPHESHSQLFQQALQKHEQVTKYIEQNLNAQDTIMKSLSEAYAATAPSRQYLNTIIHKRQSTVSALIVSFDTYEDLMVTAQKGVDFYAKLQSNVAKLLQRIRSACHVQQEEREQMLKRASTAAAATTTTTTTIVSIGSAPLPTAVLPVLPTPASTSSTTVDTTLAGTTVSSTPKLKDYLESRRKHQQPDGSTVWPSGTRPAPVGSERTHFMDCASGGTSQLAPTATPTTVVASSSSDDLTARLTSLRMEQGRVPSAFAYYPSTASGTTTAQYNTTVYGVDFNGATTQKIAGSSTVVPATTTFREYHQDGTATMAQMNATTSIHGQAGQATGVASYYPNNTTSLSGGTTNINVQNYHQSIAAPIGTVPVVPSLITNPSMSGTQTTMFNNRAVPQFITGGHYGNTSAAPSLSGYYQSRTNIANDPQTKFYQHATSGINTPQAFSQYYPSSGSQTAFSGTGATPPFSTSSNAGSTVVTETNSQQIPFSAVNYSPQSTCADQFPGYYYPNVGNNGMVSYYAPDTTTPVSTTSNYSQSCQNVCIPPNSISTVGTENTVAAASTNQMQLGGTAGNYYQGANGQNVVYNPGSGTAAVIAADNYSLNSQRVSIPPMSVVNTVSSQNVAVTASTNQHVQFGTASNYYQDVNRSTTVYYPSSGTAVLPGISNTGTTIGNVAVSAPNNYSQGGTPPVAVTCASANQQTQFGTAGSYYYQNTTGPTTNNNQYSASSTAAMPGVSHQQAVPIVSTASSYGYQQHQQLTSSTQAPVTSATYYSNYYAHGIQAANSCGYANPVADQTVATDNNQQHPQLSVTGGALSQAPLVEESPKNKESNIDLLAGIDFAVSQPPLVPQKLEEVEVRSEPSPPSVATVSIAANKSDVNSGEKLTKETTVPRISSVSSSTEVNTGGERQCMKPLNNAEVVVLFQREYSAYQRFVEKLTSAPKMLEQKWRELQEKQEADKLPISVARCYPHKNRYSDILPYDATRVELKTAKDDYINATHIRNVSIHVPPLIVTQSPLASTAEDFWLMVYEENVDLIVCLLGTNEMDDYDVYWPTEVDANLTFGACHLTLITENQRDFCVERMISLRFGEPKRPTCTIVHLQFSGWPRVANLFPHDPRQFVEFTKFALVHLYSQQHHSKPILVHCSSGTGRTGAFLLLFIAILEASNSGGGLMPDLIALTGKLNTFHRSLLYNRDYLKFACEALLTYVQHVIGVKNETVKVGSTSNSVEDKTAIVTVADPLNELDAFWADKRQTTAKPCADTERR